MSVIKRDRYLMFCDALTSPSLSRYTDEPALPAEVRDDADVIRFAEGIRVAGAVCRENLRAVRELVRQP